MSGRDPGGGRMAELCRQLRPILGPRIDRFWRLYLAESDATVRAELEQTLELLAAKHLNRDYQPDRSPFPPPVSDANGGNPFPAHGVPLGDVVYADKAQFPFRLSKDRMKEHLLICGRSGSGKTNLTFVLMQGLMDEGVKVLALDWKRGYRDLLQVQPNLRVFTVGRHVSPLRFNPLIPPPGCDPHVWIKQIVDVIGSAYLGGEGVISLLVAGLDKLYRDQGVYDGKVRRWPTMADLLHWLRNTKLTGRAAMWQASAERILLAMTYGEFADVVHAPDNGHIEALLDEHVVLEMDGLSSASDRVMFSESLVLYLQRMLLERGPRDRLRNMIVLEEAHHLLLAKPTGTRESVLETSIRMIRQYGLGYVFVDQSASMLSKVAFANSYAMIALSQKLSADVRAMGAAMNLSDEQKQALSTLTVGTAVVRLADERPEPFLVRVPRSPVVEGRTTDDDVRQSVPAGEGGGKGQAVAGENGSDSGDIRSFSSASRQRPVIPAVPPAEEEEYDVNGSVTPSEDASVDPSIDAASSSHPPPIDERVERVNPTDPNIDADPPTHQEEEATENEATAGGADPPLPEPGSPQRDGGNGDTPPPVSREALRFLADVAQRPLSTTVSRYQRLHLSRRRGNAIRADLCEGGLIEPVRIATRSGQVVLHQLTGAGRDLCRRVDIDPGPAPAAGLAHRYWARRAARHFTDRGYEVAHEVVVAGNGTADLVATRGNERIQVEIETGRSDIAVNLTKAPAGDFDRLVVVATAPEAVTACRRALDALDDASRRRIELLSWLDFA